MTNPNAKLLRDEIRSKALSTSGPSKSKLVSFRGIDIEIREQSLSVALSHIEADVTNTTPAQRAVSLLIDYAYVPGHPDVRVFEDSDMDVLLQLPFNNEWIQVQNAVSEIMGLTKEEVDQVKGDLIKSPLDI
jgi:hypothetical protein